MDHFSKALEQAHRRGESVRDWVQPSAEPATREPESLELAGKSVTLDPEHLINRHIVCGPDADEAAVADLYRMLRTQLLHRMNANGWSSMAVTSPGPKAGKSLTSMNLALCFAWDEKRQVLLIDADLRKPTVAQDLGIQSDRGLIDYLTGAAELAEVAFRIEQFPNLTVIPGRRLDDDEPRPELLNSARMLSLLDTAARGDYLVVVDMPPVFIGDDVIRLAKHLQSVLMVVEEGGTQIEELVRAKELLEEFNLLGTVLNKSSEKLKDSSGYYHAALKPDSQA